MEFYVIRNEDTFVNDTWDYRCSGFKTDDLFQATRYKDEIDAKNNLVIFGGLGDRFKDYFVYKVVIDIKYNKC